MEQPGETAEERNRRYARERQRRHRLKLKAQLAGNVEKSSSGQLRIMADIETSQSPITVQATKESDNQKISSETAPKIAEDDDKDEVETPTTLTTEIVTKQNGIEPTNGKDSDFEPMEVDEEPVDDTEDAKEELKIDEKNGGDSEKESNEEDDDDDGTENEEKDESLKDKPAEKEKENGKPSNGDVIGIDSDSDDEPMEVDGDSKTNGGMDDLDKPVSIGSDSESESDITSQSNSNAPTQDNSDIQEILSDKEDDCVVIDDKEDNNKSGSASGATKADGDIDPLGIDKASSASCSPISFKIATPEAKILREPPSLTMVDTAKLLKTNLPGVTIQKTSPNKNLLPALSDDMFVLEAPSFIVPYIYEKPPGTVLKEIVATIAKEVKEQEKENEAEKEKLLAQLDENERNKKMLDDEAEAERKTQKRKPKRKNDDDEWEEEDTEDEEDSDEEGEGVTKVLIKDLEDDLSKVKEHIITPESIKEAIIGGAGKKSDSFFDSALGKFFMGIGVNLVQEHVQTDLLRQQRRKRDREASRDSNAPISASTQMAINSLMKNLETSKENNAPFKFEVKRCEYCNFKSESALAMAHHYETPHSRLNLHKCNFCQYESKHAHEILYHMEALHNIKGRLEKPISYHQCPNCMFEDNGKSKLARHALACVKKFKPESNLSPPIDWDPPAKIPKIKPKHGLVGTATAYQMAAQQQQAQLLLQQQKAAAAAAVAQQRNAAIAAAMRNRGRGANSITQKTSGGSTVLRGNTGTTVTALGGRNFNLSMSGGNFIQNSGNRNNKSTTPSISITPVPRQSTSAAAAAAAAAAANSAAFNPLSAAATTKIPPGVAPGMKPGQNPNSTGKTSFVICEICDGYIKDLDQLRNHMQWIHKVKIHPKMIYNRPPLNCQKCQYRFFTDQGLERHLLGSHGLVTSSMQEAANKGKDAGRCPVCGRVYQWKLLNHVSRDHNMTLKPAHLSYKCTVCTATFGMYKQFESHVYSAHSTVAKKTGGTNNSGSSSGGGGGGGQNSQSTKSSGGSQSLLKPLKINDEITIIPQPSKPVIANTKPIEIE